MGFTSIEKIALKALCRDSMEIEKARETLPDGVMDFIRSKNLTNQVTDYARFPYMKHKQTKAENLEVVKMFDADFNLCDVLQEIGESLSAPFTIKIDCSFLLSDPDGDYLNLALITVQ